MKTPERNGGNRNTSRRDIGVKADLTGERILVTGGARRIGRAIAVAFASHGASVVVHYRRSRCEAEQLVAELGGAGAGHECVGADLLVKGERDTLIANLHSRQRPLTGLVNNASVYRRRPLVECDRNALQQDYEINFMAPFLLMRDFAVICEQGQVINLLDQRVASVEASAGGYALAKKSLRDATRMAALEWAPAVRVNAVAPGLVFVPPGVDEEKMKPLLQNVPLRQRTPAEDVAEACVFLAAQENVTGHVLFVDGGMHLCRPVVPEVPRGDYC